MRKPTARRTDEAAARAEVDAFRATRFKTLVQFLAWLDSFDAIDGKTPEEHTIRDAALVVLADELAAFRAQRVAECARQREWVAAKMSPPASQEVEA